jgi:hypothetical protein
MKAGCHLGTRQHARLVDQAHLAAIRPSHVSADCRQVSKFNERSIAHLEFGVGAHSGAKA